MKNKIYAKSIGKRTLAVAMAGVMLAGTAGSVSKAGAPQVEVDEAVYVNMDYYGAVEDIGVVKSCLLNGNTTVEDYGNYEDVINMTNRVEPTKENGKLTWDLGDAGDGKFYYECKSKDLQSEIPWTFDVTYRLDGVQKKAEDLVHANGMVSVEIKATPNETVADYYKNNFALMCGTAVDMDKTLSLEAPGAQVQSFGTTKGVIFMGLPGEEGDYTINIGSSDFESYGIFFMMVPVTFDSLDMINDIRDARETAEDSLDDMSVAADAVLDNVVAMKDDMASTKTGLEAAQDAHETFKENRDSVKADTDAAIESLGAISSYIDVLNSEFEVGEDNYNKVNDRLQAINDTVYGIQGYYDDMDDTMDSLADDVHNIRKVLKGTVDAEGLEALKQAFALDGGTEYTGDFSDRGIAALLGKYQAALKSAGGDPVISGLVDSEDLIDTLNDVLNKVDSVMTQTDALSDFMTDDVRDDILTLCDDIEELNNQVAVTLVTTQSALKSIRYTLDTMEPSMDIAINSSLDGMIGLLTESMNMTDNMELVRTAKNTMKSAIDDELDKIDDDSNVLQMDVTT